MSEVEFLSNGVQRLCIYEVGDCGLQSYQTEMKMKRATNLEFTTYTPILYIHCYAPFLFIIRLIFMSFTIEK